MLDEVRRFIKREALFSEGSPLWVAVSGGMDSMVLLHVLRRLGHSCSVAHVDHGLRGPESDGDKAFVEDHCRQHGIPFRSTRVEVGAHAGQHGISTQMAARDLRYEWFATLWKESPMPIAMAHHANDAVETLLLHLLRGTGVHGWSAIRPISGVFVRPLLGVHQNMIRQYAEENGVAFRQDASNEDPKYLRNRVRHEVLPLLEELRPGSIRTMSRAVALLRELEEAGQQMSILELQNVRPGEDGVIRIPFALIEGSAIPNLLLHRIVRPFGFHPDTLSRIIDAIAERATGSLFSAGSYQVCVDRTELIIGTSACAPGARYVIDPEQPGANCGPFRWELTDGAQDRPANMFTVLLDADRLAFPLVMRPWRHGDRMRPLGLGGSKLVSDILVDAKVSAFEKPGIYVMISAGEVVWLVGHRLAEGFQATAGSCRTLRCTFIGR